MPLVFRQLKYGPVGRSSGLDVESCQFLSFCNDSVRQLMNRGDFWSNVGAVECCTRINGALVWPRGVSTVLAVNVCGHAVEMQNRWYRFRPMEREHYEWGMDYRRHGRAGNLVCETNGVSPVFNQITSPGFIIRTFISQPSDVGKTITYYGIDQNGQVVRTVRSDGTWQEGVQVTLANPSVDTPMQFQRVTRVAKDETNGPLNCYQFNVQQGFLLDLAQYQPTERNPEYVVTRIVGNRGHGGVGIIGNNCCPKSVSALVKLNFVPFKYDDDLVQIDNEDAIRDMVKSIRKKESGDLEAALAFETTAIHELNLENYSKMPDEQMVVENRTFGGVCPVRRLF
jgi:hypothetical protein